MGDSRDIMAGRVAQVPGGRQEGICSEKNPSAALLKAGKDGETSLEAERLHGMKRKERLCRQSNLSSAVLCCRELS